MSAAITLLRELDSLGVELDADGDRLRFRPASAVPPAIRHRMRTLKPDLLDLLRQRQAPDALAAALRIGGRAVEVTYRELGPLTPTADGWRCPDAMQGPWRERFVEACTRLHRSIRVLELAEHRALVETLTAMRTESP